MNDVTRLISKTLRVGAYALVALPLLTGCDGVNPNQRMMNNPAYYQTAYGRGAYPQYPSVLPPQTVSQNVVRSPYWNQYDRAGMDGNTVARPCFNGRERCEQERACVRYEKVNGRMQFVNHCADCKGADCDKKEEDKKTPADPSGGLTYGATAETKVLQKRDNRFEVICKADGIDPYGPPDSDHDGISDACEDHLRTLKTGGWPAMDKAKFNGYAVSVVALDDEKLREKLTDIPADKISWFDKSILNRSSLNQRMSELFVALKDRAKSDIGIIEILYGAAKDDTYYMDNQFVTQCINQEDWPLNVAFIAGGYGQPLVYNPFEFASSGAERFTTSTLTGAGSNLATLAEGDKFLYLVESYVWVPRREVPIRLGTIDGDSRVAGAFMVFVDGGLQLVSLDLQHAKSKFHKELAKSEMKLRGRIVGGGWRHFVVTLVSQEEKNKAEIGDLIKENILVNLDGTNWELMPQEISRAEKPAEMNALAPTDKYLLPKVRGKVDETVGDATDGSDHGGPETPVPGPVPGTGATADNTPAGGTPTVTTPPVTTPTFTDADKAANDAAAGALAAAETAASAKGNRAKRVAAKAAREAAEKAHEAASLADNKDVMRKAFAAANAANAAASAAEASISTTPATPSTPVTPVKPKPPGQVG